jgi:hypothetical protein
VTAFRCAVHLENRHRIDAVALRVAQAHQLRGARSVRRLRRVVHIDVRATGHVRIDGHADEPQLRYETVALGVQVRHRVIRTVTQHAILDDA